MKFIKINELNVNVEQIVSIEELKDAYWIRLSNADNYCLPNNKQTKKLIDGVLNEEVQLPSKRVTKRTD